MTKPHRIVGTILVALGCLTSIIVVYTVFLVLLLYSVADRFPPPLTPLPTPVLCPDRTNLINISEIQSNLGSRVLKGHTADVSSLVFSPDGKQLASGSYDQTVRTWDLESGNERRNWAHTGFVSAVDWSRNGRWIATGSWDQVVRVFDVESGKESFSKKEPWWRVFSIAFSPDSKLLAASSRGRIKVWDMESKDEILDLTKDWDTESIAFSPDGTTLATASGDIRLWQIPSGQELYRLIDPSPVIDLHFSPDGKYLAAASSRMIKLWDPNIGREKQAFKYLPILGSMAISPDGHILVAETWYRVSIIILDIEHGCVLGTLSQDSNASIYKTVFSPDGNLIAAAVSDGTIRLWRIK